MIQISCDGKLMLTHSNGTKLSGLLPSVIIDGCVYQPDDKWTYDIQNQSVMYTLDGMVKIKVDVNTADGNWVELNTSLCNLSNRDLKIDAVTVTSGSIEANVRWILQNNIDMCGECALVPIREHNTSNSVMGFTDAEGDHAVVAGFTNLGDAFCDVASQGCDGKLVDIKATVNREGVELPSDGTLQAGTLRIGAAQSLRSLMAEYAVYVGQEMGARVPKNIMTGWCSWYYYCGSENEEEILANAKLLSEAPFADDLQVVQIDDGWTYPSAEIGRNWGDWYAGYKFPNGMKHTVDSLKALGLKAGLWLAPFSVMTTSNFYKEHPELLVQCPDKDEPILQWGCCGLDLTHPQALEHLRQTFIRVFDVWGFDYIKIDFLLHGIMPGRRHDPTQTTAQAFRNAMKIIREVAAERFILNCGSPMGPSIGYVDAMRIGYDVSSRWFLPMNLESWPNGNCAIKPAAVATTWRHWMHNAWWQNDPDCVVVRAHGAPGEIASWTKEGVFVSDPPYGLNYEEAAGWLRLVWFSGGLVMLSENLADMEQDRYQLLDKLFPLNNRPTGWVDYYPCLDVAVFKTLDDASLMVGIFNVGDLPVQLNVPADKLGLQGAWSFKEWLTGEVISGSGDQVEFPELPAHGGRIWIMQ